MTPELVTVPDQQRHCPAVIVSIVIVPALTQWRGVVGLRSLTRGPITVKTDQPQKELTEVKVTAKLQPERETDLRATARLKPELNPAHDAKEQVTSPPRKAARGQTAAPSPPLSVKRPCQRAAMPLSTKIP